MWKTEHDEIDIAHLQGWIGRSETCEEVVTRVQAAQLAALFDVTEVPKAGEHVRALWHWANAFPPRPQAELGLDGHPARGGFLPPVELPRRMRAGGIVSFVKPLPGGRTAATALRRPLEIAWCGRMRSTFWSVPRATCPRASRAHDVHRRA